ncbi:potassium channel family protein [Streptomyces sp. NPDC046915]|uniref:potassium channel family protein n=1 Tax=Streptomyces sp. NPDC046915 TaxID=3155257 RepID=UPI0033FC9600
MSDPMAARTEHSRTGQDAHPPGRGHHAGRRAAGLAALRSLFTVTALVTAYYLLPLDDLHTTGALTLLVGGLLAVLLVFSWQVWAIVRSPHPRLRAVEALSATLGLFLVLFAGAYYLLERSYPGSFTEPLTRTDALYFTLTTFTTVGYGDITARSQAGRVVTMLQMAGGLLLVGGAARILAGAVEAGLRRQHHEPPAEPDADDDTATLDREDGP